jgi:hypothetical protein
VDSGFVRYPRPSLPDVLIHADLKVNNDTIRVYATHLQSLQLGKADYARIENVKAGDSIIGSSKGILSKIKRVYQQKYSGKHGERCFGCKSAPHFILRRFK